MNFKSKIVISLGFGAAFITAAYAQWQAPNHSVPIGRGAGITGFRSTGPCTANQLMVWTGGVGSDPICTGTLPSGLTGYALTKVDDTNVTLTLGGTPSTSLVAASSLTLGWTGQLAVGRGGTGQSTLTSDGILYGAGTGAIGSNRCTMDSNQSLTCSTSASNSPQWLPTNSSADASSANIIFQKSRSGGNSNSGDQLGSVIFKSFANSSVQNAVQIASRQTAAATGSNTPTAIDFRASDSAGQLNQTWTFDGANKALNTPTGGVITISGSSSGSAQIFTAVAAGTTNFRLPVGNGTNLQVLQTDGSGNTSWVTTAAASSTPTKQYLLSGSSATYTTPANTRSIIVVACGGGGGGGAAQTNNGSTGGTTTFNSINATGGSGGPTSGATNVGGTGGTGGTGTASFRLSGGDGMHNTNLNSGMGGTTVFGGAGASKNTNAAGSAGKTNTCAGGGGGSNGSTVAGAGGGAGEYFELIITSPASTYTYTVGGGGAGGTAGTQAGGAGGAGVIIVTEYY